MKIKGKNKGKTKTPSLRRWNRMIYAINFYQYAICLEPTRIKLPFLPFNEPNMCNDCIVKVPECIDYFCIHFPCHCVLNQVDSDTNLLDNVLSTKDALRPTKNPRSVGLHRSKLEKTTGKKKLRLNNIKFRSVSTQLREEHAESGRDEENMLQQHLFYTNEDLKYYPCIDAGTSIPIITCKLTKNCSNIVRGTSIPGCS